MNHATKEQLLAFEQKIVGHFNDGNLPFLMHFAGGNEDQLISIFELAAEGDWFFASHRAHYHALLAGIPADKVEAEILAGNSMFLFSRERNFYTSSVLAGTCAIACGVALKIKRDGGFNWVWCFLGDGAEDEGHFAEAVRYATGQDLPITFVIEDNARQVDTSYLERWGTNARMDWGPKVQRYFYEATYPHAGRGPGPMVEFKPEAIARFTNRA